MLHKVAKIRRAAYEDLKFYQDICETRRFYIESRH